MRALARALLPTAAPPAVALRSLTLGARYKAAQQTLSGAAVVPLGSMGQALSLLPLPGRQRREVAAAAGKSRAPIDRPDEEDPDLWMICGLGNPGPKYEDTRHNVGFMAIDALAKQEGIAVNRLQENAAVGRGRFCGKKVLLVKPMTFMNVSGEAVGKLARFYRIPAERIMVIYDDLDLANAAVRLRAKGGHGGHNGMKSISAHLQGTKDFPRIRIGIARPPGSVPVVTWVLQDFTKAEREEIDVALQECIDVLRAVLIVGMDRAVSGTRVDKDGQPIKPPHSNGKQIKQGNGQQQGGQQGGQQQARAAKQQQKGQKGQQQMGQQQTALAAALAAAQQAQAAAGEQQGRVHEHEAPGEGEQPAQKRQRQEEGSGEEAPQPVAAGAATE